MTLIRAKALLTDSWAFDSLRTALTTGLMNRRKSGWSYLPVNVFSTASAGSPSMVSALTMSRSPSSAARSSERKRPLAEVPDRASGNTENHFSLLMKLLTVPPRQCEYVIALNNLQQTSSFRFKSGTSPLPFHILASLITQSWASIAGRRRSTMKFAEIANTMPGAASFIITSRPRSATGPPCSYRQQRR